MSAMGQFGIGQPVRRFEDKRLLSGNGRFQHDMNLPGEARDAAELIAIDYQSLPWVTDTAEAAEGKHPVWDECPDNISNLFESGNQAATEAAFAGASQIVKRRYVISRVYAHFMEPRGAI